jgi:uncharacterized protein with HEPN domain
LSRDLVLLLEDIEGSCSKIVRFAEGKDREAVLADEMRLDAILHNLQVIGEAIKKLPMEWRARHTEVPWRSIAGLRDVVAHTYFALDYAILWDAIHQEVPRLLQRIRVLLEGERSPGDVGESGPDQ